MEEGANKEGVSQNDAAREAEDTTIYVEANTVEEVSNNDEVEKVSNNDEVEVATVVPGSLAEDERGVGHTESNSKNTKQDKPTIGGSNKTAIAVFRVEPVKRDLETRLVNNLNQIYPTATIIGGGILRKW